MSKRFTTPDLETKIDKEAARVLQLLTKASVFLAMSPKMEKAIIVSNTQDAKPRQIASVDREIAEIFRSREWVTGRIENGVGRFYLSELGLVKLKRLSALKSNDAANVFGQQHKDIENRDIFESDGTRRFHINANESPLTALARKRDKHGDYYLTKRMIQAGERLREDFEISQIGPRITQNWDRFLVASARGDYRVDGVDRSDAAEIARARLSKALATLGPGLADIAFRCCCFLEGLERAEKKLEWSARSGKIVLRIALDRLADFYEMPKDEQKMAKTLRRVS